MAADHGDAVLGPEPLDGLEVLDEARYPLRLAGAEGLELDLAVAETAAEDQVAAGDQVDGGVLLGDVEGLVQREQDDSGGQSQARHLGRDAGQERQLLDLLEGRGAVVAALGDLPEAELFGEPGLRHQLLEALAHVVARRKLAADGKSKLHDRSPLGHLRG